MRHFAREREYFVQFCSICGKVIMIEIIISVCIVMEAVLSLSAVPKTELAEA